MKVEYVLGLVLIAFVDASEDADGVKVTTKTVLQFTNSSSSEEIQTTPKHTKHDVVSLNSIDGQSTSAPNNKWKPKKPLMLKIIPKAMKIKNINYWKSATTRKPLMKYTKFTINPLAMYKLPKDVTSDTKTTFDKKKHTERKYNTSKMLDATKKDDSSEEIFDSTPNNVNQSDKIHKTSPLPFSAVPAGENNKSKKTEDNADIKSLNNTMKERRKVSESDLSSEERVDREEFIFVKPEKISKNSEESEETSTLFETDTKPRQKRSINVIEEENLGTTVSGFKFTGTAESLSSDLVFRNINT